MKRPTQSSPIALWVAALMLGLPSCGGSASPTAEADLLVLLQSCGLPTRKVQVWQSQRSRQLLAEFSASTNEIQQIIKGLKLDSIDPTNRAPGWEVVLRRKQARSIRAHPYLDDRAPVRLYKSGVRGPELLLKNGTQFEYLMFYVPTNAGPVLLQAAYAYG